MTTLDIYLEHANGPLEGQRVPLVSEGELQLSIGRDGSCDLVTEPEFQSVSARHAIVTANLKGIFITDVGSAGGGSSYGTFINNGTAPLDPNQPYRLGRGDKIRLGESKILMLVPVRTGQEGLFSRLTVNEKKRQISVDDQLVRFTRQEFQVVALLWKAGGNVCTTEALHLELWPDDPPESVRGGDRQAAIHDLVRRVRRKLANQLPEGVLETVRGEGYRLRTLRTGG